MRTSFQTLFVHFAFIHSQQQEIPTIRELLLPYQRTARIEGIIHSVTIVRYSIILYAACNEKKKQKKKNRMEAVICDNVKDENQDIILSMTPVR